VQLDLQDHKELRVLLELLGLQGFKALKDLLELLGQQAQQDLKDLQVSQVPLDFKGLVELMLIRLYLHLIRNLQLAQI
jgi:hypothetical protein